MKYAINIFLESDKEKQFDVLCKFLEHKLEKCLFFNNEEHLLNDIKSKFEIKGDFGETKAIFYMISWSLPIIVVYTTDYAKFLKFFRNLLDYSKLTYNDMSIKIIDYKNKEVLETENYKNRSSKYNIFLKSDEVQFDDCDLLEKMHGTELIFADDDKDLVDIMNQIFTVENFKSVKDVYNFQEKVKDIDIVKSKKINLKDI